jgi:CBS domain containing-hemolysin-like protein
MIAHAWTTWAGWLAALAAGTAFCAMFCGLETGIYVLNKVRLDLRAEAGNRQARLLRRLLRSPENLLAVLLIGTNLSSYAVAFAVTAMFDLAGRQASAEWLALAVVTPLLFVFGDSVPKNVFRRLAETLTYRLSWLLVAAHFLFTVTGVLPLIRALTWLLTRGVRGRSAVPEDRLGALLAEGQASGVLTHIQSVMADRVRNIADVTLADVMVPTEKVAWAARGAGRDELLKLVKKSSYSRLPVRDDKGDVVGILDTYDVLVEEGPSCPTERMVPPLNLPAGMTVTEALYRMQRGHVMMAVVQSAGRCVGIVTIKDLVEEIVGELEEW